VAAVALHSVFRVADRAVLAAAVPLGIGGSYLGALSLLARPKAPPSPDLSVQFVVVVPAHDEEIGISDTVKNVQSVDYPPGNVRIVVVADNCSDATAERARAAGAEVIERTDPQHRGKGYALAFAFERLLGEHAPAHAIVVVDADTRVSSNLLQAFSGHLATGAQAMQASYRVANASNAWRAALMSVAFACMHDVRSLGRERLGLSTGLRGNGMCFSTRSLQRVPHRSTSLVEDVEHGLDLAARGVRVEFVHEASVEAEMPEHDDNAASQRQRWERGRAALRRERGLSLILDAVRNVDPVRADLAADLIMPPLAQLVAAFGVVGSATVAVSAARRHVSWATIPLGLGGLGLCTHIAQGWRQSGTGVAGLRALTKVPTYILWKLGLQRAGQNRKSSLGNSHRNAEDWVRTTRNAERLERT
jgi:1,2-diacylglycerol 3-beta-glucosyltransferase